MAKVCGASDLEVNKIGEWERKVSWPPLHNRHSGHDAALVCGDCISTDTRGMMLPSSVGTISQQTLGARCCPRLWGLYLNRHSGHDAALVCGDYISTDTRGTMLPSSVGTISLQTLGARSCPRLWGLYLNRHSGLGASRLDGCILKGCAHRCFSNVNCEV